MNYILCSNIICIVYIKINLKALEGHFDKFSKALMHYYGFQYILFI